MDAGLGYLELSNLDGTARRRIPTPDFDVRYLAFERSGSLLVTGWSMATSRSVLARVSENAPPVILATESRYMVEPRISRDGTQVAFVTSDLESTSWWVDR